MQTLPNCVTCGRFCTMVPGASFAMRYSGYPPTPDHEDFQCVRCTVARGPLQPQDGMAAWTAGVISRKDTTP